MPPEAMPWVVGLLVMGVLSAFGFLARNAVVDLKEGITGLGAKMDGLKDTVAKSDTRAAVADARIAALERDRAEDRAALAEVRRELRELSEGVAR